MKLKKVRGYVFCRTFMGERVPTHVQNLVIRQFCKEKKLEYLLSGVEYAMKDSSLILENLIDDKDNNGIIAYSLFQLPFNDEKRKDIYKKIIKKKKLLLFAVEKKSVSTIEDISLVEQIWKIKKVIYQENYESIENCLKD
jgi:sporadic carbohydrate cluster protein (TIGR04323 family)